MTLVSQCWLFFFSLSFSLPPRLSFLSRFLRCLPRHDLLNLLLLLLLLRLQLSKCRNLTGECVAVKVKQPQKKKNNLLPVSLLFFFLIYFVFYSFFYNLSLVSVSYFIQFLISTRVPAIGLDLSPEIHM